MSNRFLLSLHHASVILLPNSASPPLDTATRCGEEGKRETSLREEATGHRGLFTREFNLCVLLYSNEQVCRVQSTKHEENVQRCSRYSSLPVHTLLSRKVFSRLCRICGGDRLESMARFQFFFLPYSSLPTSVRIVSFKHSGSTFCICLILKKGMLNQFF